MVSHQSAQGIYSVVGCVRSVVSLCRWPRSPNHPGVEGHRADALLPAVACTTRNAGSLKSMLISHFITDAVLASSPALKAKCGRPQILLPPSLGDNVRGANRDPYNAKGIKGRGEGTFLAIRWSTGPWRSRLYGDRGWTSFPINFPFFSGLCHSKSIITSSSNLWPNTNS